MIDLAKAPTFVEYFFLFIMTVVRMFARFLFEKTFNNSKHKTNF
jgi:hypothetical protein